MPHDFTPKDLEEMVWNKLDNRSKKPSQSIIARLQQAVRLKTPQLPKFPKV